MRASFQEFRDAVVDILFNFIKVELLLRCSSFFGNGGDHITNVLQDVLVVTQIDKSSRNNIR